MKKDFCYFSYSLFCYTLLFPRINTNVQVLCNTICSLYILLLVLLLSYMGVHSLPRTTSFSVRASHVISISQFKGNVIFKKSVLGNSEDFMRAGNVLVRFRILFFVRASREGSVLFVLAHRGVTDTPLRTLMCPIMLVDLI